MCVELAYLINAHPSCTSATIWNAKENCIRCLAHVINLATQAVIKKYSNSKHYDPANPDEHEPDTETIDRDGSPKVRDPVGIVRAIAVKACSSPKRKQMLKEIQLRANVHPLQLLIDMVVHWSLTYIMLCRADTLKPYMGTFIYEMGMAEPNLGKR
ncbi:hypothetical protein FB446DRAFT_706684 [Lentinula raphanica]|nr:hypothetical protein FB446DRAFT_706684 [Lentinula raphanica]